MNNDLLSNNIGKVTNSKQLLYGDLSEDELLSSYALRIDNIPSQIQSDTVLNIFQSFSLHFDLVIQQGEDIDYMLVDYNLANRIIHDLSNTRPFPLCERNVVVRYVSSSEYYSLQQFIVKRRSNSMSSRIDLCLPNPQNHFVERRFSYPFPSHQFYPDSIDSSLNSSTLSRSSSQLPYTPSPFDNDYYQRSSTSLSQLPIQTPEYHPYNPSKSQAEGPPGANIFVYHLPSSITDSDLTTLFIPFGPIISAKVFVDKQTGLSKGFGFVSYYTPEMAQNAIKYMNGFKIDIKRLKVQIKKEK